MPGGRASISNRFFFSVKQKVSLSANVYNQGKNNGKESTHTQKETIVQRYAKITQMRHVLAAFFSRNG